MRDTKLKPLLIFLPLGPSHFICVDALAPDCGRLAWFALASFIFDGLSRMRTLSPRILDNSLGLLLLPSSLIAWLPRMKTSHSEFWTTRSMCHAWGPWQAKLTKFVSGMDVAVCKEFWSTFTPLVSFFPRLRGKIKGNTVGIWTRWIGPR